MVVGKKAGHRHNTVVRPIRPCPVGRVLVVPHLDNLGGGKNKAAVLDGVAEIVLGQLRVDTAAAD